MERSHAITVYWRKGEQTSANAIASIGAPGQGGLLSSTARNVGFGTPQVANLAGKHWNRP